MHLKYLHVGYMHRTTILYRTVGKKPNMTRYSQATTQIWQRLLICELLHSGWQPKFLGPARLKASFCSQSSKVGNLPGVSRFRVTSAQIDNATTPALRVTFLPYSPIQYSDIRRPVNVPTESPESHPTTVHVLLVHVVSEEFKHLKGVCEQRASRECKF